MVFYFETTAAEDGRKYLMYMGKDKYENEDLIKYGLPEDCWFHVDDLSSAHVYLRLQPNQTLDDIPPEIVLDCASLVKANSISGCKMNSVYVIYTRWKNLKKTNDMVEGQVSYHRPENVKRIKAEKNNTIVNKLNKTKVEKYPDLYKLQQDRQREIIFDKKETQRAKEKLEKSRKLEQKKRKEELSYDRIMDATCMTSNKDIEATDDATAAEEYEEDFF